MTSIRKRLLRAALVGAVGGVTPFALFSAMARANTLPGVVQVQQLDGHEKVTARLLDGSELIIDQPAPSAAATLLVRKENATTPAQQGDYTLASGHTLHLRRLPNGTADWVVSDPRFHGQTIRGDDYSRMIMPTSMLDWIINYFRDAPQTQPAPPIQPAP